MTKSAERYPAQPELVEYLDQERHSLLALTRRLVRVKVGEALLGIVGALYLACEAPRLPHSHRFLVS